MATGNEKVLFYYHHSGGQGHATWIAAICKELKKRKSCQVIVVNSGRKQLELGIERYATVLDLPFLETEDGSSLGLKPDISFELALENRWKILKKLQSRFRPDVAVFEDVPFGNVILVQETDSFMELLHKDGCILYLSVRDIVGRSVDVVQLLRHVRQFNGILVHSEKDREILINCRDSKEWKEKIFLLESLEHAGAGVVARLIEVACYMECLKVHLLTQCNLACDMCNWKEKEQFPPFPLEVFQNLVARAKVAGIREVHVVGGEVTLLPNIRNILQYIRNNGLRVAMSTNGYGVPSKWVELAPLIDSVEISLDSYDARVHDRIRGRSGAFERTMGTIKLLAGHRMNRHVNVTVRPDNYRGLHRMLSLLEGQIDSISFNLVDMGDDPGRSFVFSEDQLMMFYFKEVSLILRECVKRKIRVSSIHPFFKELTGDDEEKILYELLARKQEYMRRFRTIFALDNMTCHFRKQLQVDVNGEIFCCGFMNGVKAPLGNVIKNDLCDILVSDTYFDFFSNICPGEGLCKECKSFFVMNYGE